MIFVYAAKFESMRRNKSLNFNRFGTIGRWKFRFELRLDVVHGDFCMLNVESNADGYVQCH